MKHKHRNRTLGRNSDGRRRLLRGLASSLLEHREITTTAASARELRRFFEPLVTEAKQELTLHRRRRLLQRLAHKRDLERLVELAHEHRERPGGYTRITRLPISRRDAAATVRISVT